MSASWGQKLCSVQRWIPSMWLCSSLITGTKCSGSISQMKNKSMNNYKNTQAKSPTYVMRMDKSNLTTGGPSGWNTKIVRCPIMFKLAVHPKQLVWHWWHSRRGVLHKKEHLKRDRNYVGWKHLVFQIRGNTLSSEVSLPKASAVKTKLHDPSCQELSSYGNSPSFSRAQSNLINKMKTFIERQYRGVVKSAGSGTECLHSNPSLAWPWQRI